MLTQYEKTRYVDERGYSILHTRGTHASDSTLPYLHYSRTYMLLWFRQGTGSIKIEGRHYTISEGDLIILNPAELFQISVDDKPYHERMSVTINETLFSSYPDAVSSLFAPLSNRRKGIGNRIPAEAVKSSGIGTCLDRLLGYASTSGEINQLLAFCCISELLALIGEGVTSEAVGQAISNPLIGAILEYLNLHFSEDIDIPKVAANFNIDKSYLSHLFKEHVGMSLWTYVVLRRIQYFNNLVREDAPLEELAYRAGFKNYSNFFRLYKKYMKTTPTQFRRQTRVKDRMIDTDTQLF